MTKVTNEIHIGGNYYSDVKTHCKMRFFYSDGTTNDVQKERHNSYRRDGQGWGGQTYTNPHPTKPVRKIEVHLHSQDNGHEKNTVVHRSDGGSNVAGPVGDVVVSDSKKTAIHNNLFRRPDENAHCIFIANAPDDGLTIHGNAFWRTLALESACSQCPSRGGMFAQFLSLRQYRAYSDRGDCPL